MLAFLSAAALLGQAATPPSGGFTLQDLELLLTDGGYSIVRSVGNGQFEVKLAPYDGVRDCSAYCARAEGVPEADRKVLAIRFTVEFAVSRDVDVTAPFDLAAPEGSHVKTTLTPHIGNTLSAISYVTDVPKLTRAQLLEALTTAWVSVERFARQFQPDFEPAFGPRTESMKNCERRLFTCPDPDSLARLLRHWGWGERWAGGSSGGWSVDGTFGNHQGWVRQAPPSHGSERSFCVGLVVRGFPTDMDKWVSLNASRYPWAEFRLRDPKGVTDCEGLVKLTPQTTVGDVKKQILAFVWRVQQLEKDLR